MLIYLCPPLREDNELKGMCEVANAPINQATKACRRGVLIAAWAIGGAVSVVMNGYHHLWCSVA